MQGLSPGLPNRQLAFDFDNDPPGKKIARQGATAGRGFSASVRQSNEDRADNAPGGAPKQCAGDGSWFDAIRRDNRLTVSDVSLARVILDGRRRSLVELSDATGFSLRIIPDAIKRLERAGYIAVTRGGGRGRKNSYAITMGAAS